MFATLDQGDMKFEMRKPMKKKSFFLIKKVYIYQLVGHKDEKGFKREMAMVNDFV
jgi:hypothetical protein